MIESSPGNYSLQEAISKTIAVQKEHSRRNKTALFPKRARVLDFDSEFAPFLAMVPGDNFVLEGNGYVAANNWIGRRTVFFEHPVTIGGYSYYLEVKGYGRNGRELFPNKHSEGDLMFGTYIDSARREFYIPQELEQIGINNIQRPVALLEFDEADFVKYTIDGLGQMLRARMRLFDRTRNAVRLLLPNDSFPPDDNRWYTKKYDALGRKAAKKILAVYFSGGKKALQQLAGNSGLEVELAGLTDEKQAGYIIRAVKSPIRVGDLTDPDIVTDRNRVIAHRMGKIVRAMLEIGYLDTSPNPGNWTTEGELVDFEDVLKYPADSSEISKLMSYYGKQTLPDYLEFVFGKGTIGHLTADFQEGFMGGKTTAADVVEESLKILAKLDN